MYYVGRRLRRVVEYMLPITCTGSDRLAPRVAPAEVGYLKGARKLRATMCPMTSRMPQTFLPEEIGFAWASLETLGETQVSIMRCTALDFIKVPAVPAQWRLRDDGGR